MGSTLSLVEDASAMLELRGLAKEYRNAWGRKVRALTDVSLEVRRGEVFGLLGPNGAGKTTTFTLLLGLQRPTAGTGTLLGLPLGAPEARRRLGYLPENPYFYDYLTAYELLDTFATLNEVPRRGRRDRINTVLDEVGIDPSEPRRLRKFSKGMRQRVGLALAILHRPELVILDEPMSGLDPAGRKLFRDIILRLKAEGHTVVFASHVLPDVEALCDRVGFLVGGVLRRTGTVDELVNPSEGTFEIVAAQVPDRLYLSWVESQDVKASGDRVILHARNQGEVAALTGQIFASGAILLAVRPFQSTLEDVFFHEIHSQPEAGSPRNRRGAA